ncbi:peroxidase, FMP-type [Pseudoalteromonas rubra]|uniref:peroxidase, FMP-type n=1 Tax=Pseudoalteromonas rubra TaxID=43658 RepID=UPI002DB7A6AD|nr:peroxidase, FMP-type [Pseudoalteromonas rubra]MEC4091671.1 peroxidase, FMP-type [Pseudoalteromonas rubra]
MTSKTPQSSVRPYPELKDNEPTVPQFGVLDKLHGTWVNWKGGPKGLHTTPMPSPGTSSETVFGVFHFKSQQYREQLTFTKVNAPVRNRAGSNEQFNGPVKYETAIIDNDGDLQHFENGMYLWLGDNTMPWEENGQYQNPRTMFSRPSTVETVAEDGGVPVIDPGEQGPQFVPPHSISRSGVIPHGTTIHLTGSVTNFDKEKTPDAPEKPEIAKLWEQPYLSISPTMGIDPERDLIPGSLKKPFWTNLPRDEQRDYPGQPEAHQGVNSARAYFLNIFNYDKYGAKFPYTVQPNLLLSEFNEALNFKSYDLIELDSQHDTGVQGATVNNVMIERYCRVVRMRHRMWLEQIIIQDETGKDKIIDQLQYEQIVDFEFMFGASGETTQWPHIQVNTLRRLEDIPENERYDAIELPEEEEEEPVTKPKSQVHHMNHKAK